MKKLIQTEDVNDLKNQEKYIEKAREILKQRKLQKGSELKAFIATFGCQQNEADSERLMGTAKLLGYIQAEAIEEADLIIFNTCAVRQHAELKALSKTGQIKHLKQKNPDLLVGLWGCMVTQEHRKEDIKHRYPYVDFVAGTNMLHRLSEIICDVLVHKRRRFYVDDTPHAIVEGVEVSRQNDIKANLSIMYGCDNFCTYCVVPFVRGRERSRLPENVINEAKEIIEGGYKEITLLGQNVNSYGKNLPLENSMNFARLLDNICSIEGDFRVRFMTSHPKDASDELIETMARNPKAAKHFHLPMQAGNNEILKRMNRHYTRESFYELAMKIKEKMPGVTLTTDIICGFPGETEKQFADTLDMVEKIGFDSIFSFIFSPRVGTKAAEMEDIVPYEEKTKWFSELTKLQGEISDKINSSYVGKRLTVLGDGKTEAGIALARSEGNKIIRVETDKDIYGKFAEVIIDRAEPCGLYAKLV